MFDSILKVEFGVFASIFDSILKVEFGVLPLQFILTSNLLFNPLLYECI